MMREMEQNDVYDESEFEVGAELDNEAEEDTSSHITHLWGIPVKIFVPVAVVALLIIILIVVFAMKKNGSGGDIVTPDYSQDYGIAPSTPSTTDCFVDFVYVGYIQGSAYVGAPIYAQDGSVYATLVDYGDTVVTDIFGTSLGYITTPDSYSQSPAIKESVEYSADTVSVSNDVTVELRKYGYTGDEIELALSSGISAEKLIEDAKAIQDEAAKEALKRMSDSASEEFQMMVNTTQYCMPYQEYSGADWTLEGYTNEEGSYVVNADYEKIPTYGYQLRIKVKIANGTYAFMDVNPSRYMKMPDSGNIVVQVNYVLWGQSRDNAQFYITDIVEKDITTLTVNLQDSAVNLADVIP